MENTIAVIQKEIARLEIELQDKLDAIPDHDLDPDLSASSAVDLSQKLIIIAAFKKFRDRLEGK